jgi:uncharacterized membrane protein
MLLGTLTLWLHITTMFAAVTISFGPSVVVQAAYRSGQVAMLRGVVRVIQPIERVIPVFFVVGGLFGLWTAINFGYSLLAPWLVIAYILFATVMVTGITFNRTFSARVEAATADVPDGQLTPAIRALFTDPRYRFVTVLDTVAVIAILFDMVVKPFS